MAKEYKVSLEVALKKFAASEQFRQHLRSGQYLYVEKRICLNQPKYIQWDAAAVSLTDYAREHQDECCLSPKAFTSKVQKTKKTGDRFVVRTHNRTPYTAQNRRSRVWCHKGHLPRREMPSHRFTETFSSVVVLAHSLPNNFTQMLDKLIESKNMTEEDLAESSSLSEKTIQRLRNHEPKRVTLETVINGKSYRIFTVYGSARSYRNPSGTLLGTLPVGTMLATNESTTGQTYGGYMVFNKKKLPNGYWQDLTSTGYGFVDLGLSVGSFPSNRPIR